MEALRICQGPCRCVLLLLQGGKSIGCLCLGQLQQSLTVTVFVCLNQQRLLPLLCINQPQLLVSLTRGEILG